MSANLTLRVVEDLDGEMFGTQAVTGVAASGGSGQIASDDFNRADAFTLGANWTGQATALGGNGEIISSQARGEGGTYIGFWSGAGAFTDDQYSQVTITSFAAAATVAAGVRQSGSGTSITNVTGYFLGANRNVGVSDDRYKIWKFIAGTDTLIAQVGSTTPAATSGDIIKLVVTFSGGVNTLTGHLNGSPITGLINVTDSDIGTGGKPGMIVADFSNRVDDWSAGNP